MVFKNAPHVPYRETLRDLVDYVTTHFIAETPSHLYDPGKRLEDALTINADKTLSVKDAEFWMPRTATMLFLNTCLGQNTMLRDSSGTGKTKLATVAGSLLYQLPYETMEMARRVGSTGATATDIIATLDVAEINRGNDVGFLYFPLHLPFVFFDELNRYSELEQNLIREGIATHVWQFAGHSWRIPRQVIVSGINPGSYQGTFPLNENLTDNFSMVLEGAHYNAVAHGELVQDAEDNIRRELGDLSLAEDLRAFYDSYKKSHQEVGKKITAIQHKMLAKLKKQGIPTIANGDMTEIARQVKAVPFDAEAHLFSCALQAEMTESAAFGRNRPDDVKLPGSHDEAYLTGILSEGLAGRFLQDWHQTARALAWYRGREHVSVHELQASFIYTAPLRLRIAAESEFYQKAAQEPRNVPLPVELSRRVVARAWENYSSLAGKRGGSETESMQAVRKAVRIINGEEEGSHASAVAILQGPANDHPLARTVLKAIAGGVLGKTSHRRM